MSPRSPHKSPHSKTNEKFQEKSQIPASFQHKCYVTAWILDFIKHHAKVSSREIYGWLLGRENDEGDIYILSVAACNRYVEQSVIGAIPDSREVQEIGKALPEGVGILGIYHSHPGEIFHSSVDDQTLQNFSNIYPQMLSAVTNRDVFDESQKNRTRWFQYHPTSQKVYERDVTIISTPDISIEFTPIYVSLEIDVIINEGLNLPQEILRIVLQNYSSLWSQGKLTILQKKRKFFRFLSHDALFPEQLFPLNTYLEKNFTVSQPDVDWSTITSKLSQFRMESKKVVHLSFNFTHHPSTADPSHLQDPSKIHVRGVLPFVILLSLPSHYYSQTPSQFVKKVKSTLQDQIISKISRGLLVPINTRKFQFLSGEPFILPYPGFPLTLDALIDPLNNILQQFDLTLSSLQNDQTISPSFQKMLDQLPQPVHLFSLETEHLKSLEDRAVFFDLAGQRKIALALLKYLRLLYQARHQQDRVEIVNNKIGLLSPSQS